MPLFKIQSASHYKGFLSITIILAKLLTILFEIVHAWSGNFILIAGRENFNKDNTAESKSQMNKTTVMLIPALPSSDSARGCPVVADILL